MIGYLVTVLFLSAAQAQLLTDCPPENIEVANFRLMTRDLPPIGVPNVARMDKDYLYASAELQEAMKNVNFSTSLELPDNFVTEPYVDRCCPRNKNNKCTSIWIELRYVSFQGGICWIVWPGDHVFKYERCTCCTCVLDDGCPVVGRCVETNYNTVKVISYCPHIAYNDRFQKMAIRLPMSCRCHASCPVPQHYFYKKRQIIW